MISGKTVSVNEILRRVTRLFPNYPIAFGDIISDISDGLSQIGAPLQYEDFTESIPVNNYKGELPCNLAYIKQVKDLETGIAYTYASNSFHSEYHTSDSPDLFRKDSRYSYTISKNHIHTNKASRDVVIAYSGLPVDERGYPLIPAEASYLEALTYYVAEKIAFELLLKSKIIDHVYQRVSDKKDFYMGQATSEGTIPSPDQMDAISNAWTRLLSRPLAQSEFFIDNNSPERFNS